MGNVHKLLAMIAGSLFGMFVLFESVSDTDIKFDELAGGRDGAWVNTKYGDLVFHCGARNLLFCAENVGRGAKKLVHWYGSSQVHTVRYVKLGSKVAPYYAKRVLPDVDLVVMSEPNLNFQELYVIHKTVPDRLQPDVLVIALVLDDMKEDGLRDSVRQILLSPSFESAARTQYGKDLIQRYKDTEYWHVTAHNVFETRSRTVFSIRESGSIQRNIEGRLEDALDGFFPFKKIRERGRGQLTVLFHQMAMRPVDTGLSILDSIIVDAAAVDVDLPIDRSNVDYSAILDLDSEWTVSFPRGVYGKNLSALEELVKEAGARGIEVVLYIQPRPQMPRFPYSTRDQTQFYKDIADLKKIYGVHVYNIEGIVPDNYYGLEKRNGKVVFDYFHFDERGHMVLGASVASMIDNVAIKSE